MSDKNIIKTLGSVIKAQPKVEDYEYIGKVLGEAYYKALIKGQYILSRSPQHDNDNKWDMPYINGVTMTLPLTNTDVFPSGFEVQQAFQDNNMNADKLGLYVLKSIIAADEADEKLFSDVVPVIGYKNVGSDFIDYLTKVDNPVGKAELPFTVSFILEEEKDTFLDSYNEDNNKMLIGGKISEFIYYGDEE